MGASTAAGAPPCTLQFAPCTHGLRLPVLCSGNLLTFVAALVMCTHCCSLLFDISHSQSLGERRVKGGDTIAWGCMKQGTSPKFTPPNALVSSRARIVYLLFQIRQALCVHNSIIVRFSALLTRGFAKSPQVLDHHLAFLALATPLPTNHK